MNFNTVSFFIFFALVYSLYLTPLFSWRFKKALLLLASCCFYAWWNPYYLSLVVLSTLIDYVCGMRIRHAESHKVRKTALMISMCANLGILAVFKYFNFFADSLESVFATLGFQADFITLNVLLPIGISFYTFQSMSYTIDIYRRRLEPVDDFLDFALYVTFFPQLVAGPIMRAVEFLPQLLKPPKIDASDIIQGLRWIVLGYFFKVGVADNLASSVDYAFKPGAELMVAEAWLGTYYFAAQIFGDFCGYTLIARGVARLMGFHLMENFNAPYIADGFSDFWRRWHISLSTWLRDYLYISLGGNRHGKVRTYRNLMLTMLLGGLWHGANWTFIVWGGLHGAYLVLERFLRAGIARTTALQSFVTRFSAPLLVVRIVVVFHLVCLAWVFFRAEQVTQAFDLVALMTDVGNLIPDAMPSRRMLKDGIWLVPLVLYYAWIFVRERAENLLPKVPLTVEMALLAALAFLTIVCREASDAFLYFQF